jgi:hypothetical protein
MVSASIGANHPLNDMTSPNTGLSALHPIVVARAEIVQAANAAIPNFLII